VVRVAAACRAKVLTARRLVIQMMHVLVLTHRGRRASQQRDLAVPGVVLAAPPPKPLHVSTVPSQEVAADQTDAAKACGGPASGVERVLRPAVFRTTDALHHGLRVQFRQVPY